MYSISICFGPQGTVWNLLFKTKEPAIISLQQLTDGKLPVVDTVHVADDFGQSIAVQLKSIHSVLFEELEQSQLGQIERGLHNARSQAKANQRAMQDPAIRASAMAQGPGVLTPFANGNSRFS